MTFPILTFLLSGAAPVQMPALPPQAHAVTVPPRAAESDGIRTRRLQTLVEAAEMALEEENEEVALARADEADVLTADWPTELLKQPTVQALLERLKEIQGQLAEEESPESQPGLKDSHEVVTISGEDLRMELERVRAAERDATYDFPIDLNDTVLTWVSLYSGARREFMERALSRSSMYLPMIRQIFAEEGVPSDLAYLAAVESGFRNEAKSRARAVGMWQFIRATGRIYGLTGNAWVEERRDPVKATRAAARYLKRLHETSGDWYHAIAGYNAGPLTLERAAQNTGTRNFWDLARSRWLRAETKNYVPQVCAAILVGRNPERYGLRVAQFAPYAYETVTVPTSTSLTVLARWADTDLASLKALNPELLRGSTPPGAYLLRVPPGKALECLRQMAGPSSARKRATKTPMVGSSGASSTPPVSKALMADSPLAAQASSPADSEAIPTSGVVRAQPGDTLAKLARAHQVPLGDLMRLNPEAVRALHPGDEVRLKGSPAATRAPVATPASVPATHLVRRGESLGAIARKYRLNLQDLRDWNGIVGDSIRIGQRLRLSPR